MDKFITAIVIMISTISISWYSIDLRSRAATDHNQFSVLKSKYDLKTEYTEKDTIPEVEKLKQIIESQQEEIRSLKEEIENSQNSLLFGREPLDLKFDHVIDSLDKAAIELAGILETELLKDLNQIELHTKELATMEIEINKKLQEINDLHIDIDEESLADLEKNLKQIELEKLKGIAELRVHEEELNRLELNMKEFKSELLPLLKKDNYLKNGEKIESFSIDKGELLKINGQKISPKDSKKYKKLIEKYFDSENGNIIFNKN